MRLKTYSFVLCLLILGISACLDEIELDVESGDPVLSVSGRITTDPGPYTVELTKSAKFSGGQDGIPSRVTGATIVMKDDLGTEARLTEVENGLYQTNLEDIRGTVGRSYHIEFELDGKTYLSRPEKVHPINSISSMRSSFRRETVVNEAGNFAEVNEITVLASTNFPNDSAFLKWNTFGIYEFPEIGTSGNLNPEICFITEAVDLDFVAVASAEESSSNFLQDKEVLTRNVDFRFAAGYCFNVIQQSITRETYEFWSAIEAEFQRDGNIFEAPPGKIRGNIYNPDDLEEEILGIFSASAVDTSQLFVVPAEAGTPTPRCRPFPRPGPECENCLSIPNSTTARPSCWN